MDRKMYLDVFKQTVKLEFTRRFSFVNLSAFVCELVCICVWNCETLLTWLDSRMHFFQQGTLCSQSDASLVFRREELLLSAYGNNPFLLSLFRVQA